MARFDSTSLTFMLVWVPEPVCHTTSGKCSSNLPASTSSAARTMARPIRLGRTPKSIFTMAQPRLRMANARITGAGIRSPPISKLCRLRWVCAPQYLSSATAIGPKASVSVRVAGRAGVLRRAMLKSSAFCPVGETAASGAPALRYAACSTSMTAANASSHDTGGARQTALDGGAADQPARRLRADCERALPQRIDRDQGRPQCGELRCRAAVREIDEVRHEREEQKDDLGIEQVGHDPVAARLGGADRSPSLSLQAHRPGTQALQPEPAEIERPRDREGTEQDGLRDDEEGEPDHGGRGVDDQPELDPGDRGEPRFGPRGHGVAQDQQ